jgi:hypothetical protein
MGVGRNPIELAARCGYGARGVVYGLVGSLALFAAVGSGGQAGGSRSALQSLVGQPFGRTMLVLIALGLAAFAVWRVLEAVTDADRHGTSWKGLAIRGAHLLSGFVYAGLTLSAIGIVLGTSGGGGEDAAARDWTAWLLSQPFGRWLVGLAGVVIAGTGLGFLLKAWRGT